MARRRRKGRWSLRQISIEVNLWIARIGVLFSKEPPEPVRRKRARKARQIVQAEYRILQAGVPTDIRPYISPLTPHRSAAQLAYPVFGVDANGLPKNVVGETIVQLTTRARTKAVRDGDAVTALAAALIEQVVVNSARNGEETSRDGPRW